MSQDPYEILNLSPNSSIEDVNRAYFYIAKIYHPNKGGNEEEFMRFQKAYKQIVEAHAHAQGLGTSIQAPKDFINLRAGSQASIAATVAVEHQFRPDDFSMPVPVHTGSNVNVQDRFSQELFNRRFQEQRQGLGTGSSSTDEGAYTYNIDEMDMVNANRKTDDYKREYAQVTAEAEKIVPFGNGRFNNATFNHAFVHLKEKNKRERGELDEVGIPNPTTSREIMTCTNLEDPRNPGTGDYTGFSQAYSLNHHNPNDYDRKFLSQFQGKPDITKISSLNNGEIRKLVSNRKHMQLEYNKEKLVTDLSVPLKEVEGLESKKAAMQLQRQREMLLEQAQSKARIADSEAGDMFARMSALRAPVHMAPPNVLGPERPIASSAKGFNRGTAGYISQPAAILLNPSLLRGTPPPIQKKRKSRQVQVQSQSQDQSNVEKELRQMKRHLRNQDKIIKQLSRRLGD